MHITRATVLCGLFLLSACGGDDDGPPPFGGAGGSGGGGSGGSGGMDAMVAMDSGDDDASDEDAGAAPTCIPTDDDKYSIETLTPDRSAFSLLGSPAGFGLAYEISTCGDGIDVMRFPSRGGMFAAQTVVNSSSGGTCSRAYDPALYFESSQWRLYFWDNRGGSNQLWSLVLDSGAEPTLQVASAEGGRTPMLTRINGVAHLAWVEQATPSADWTALYLRELNDTAATPIEVIAPSAMQHGFGFVVSGIESVGAAAWVDTQSTDRGAFIQPLNENGGIAGLPVKLAAQVSNKSSVDLADGAMNAAVVYSTVTDNVAFEVRFRPLDDTGRPTGIEERIVSRAERGTDASIAAIGNGYVVAYRELPAVADGTAKVKLFLIDKTGRRLGPSADIADTTADGGRVTVRSSFDGRFSLAWIEADGESQRVRMVRIPCR